MALISEAKRRHAIPGVDERLDAHPVACQQHPPPPRIPDRKREHPPESGHTIRPPGSYAASTTSVSEDFGTGGRALELRPQLPEVVDLTIVRDPRGAVLGRHRLHPALEVNDGESPMSQPDRPVDMKSFTVRAPMCQAVRHPPNSDARQLRGRDEGSRRSRTWLTDPSRYAMRVRISPLGELLGHGAVACCRTTPFRMITRMSS